MFLFLVQEIKNRAVRIRTDLPVHAFPAQRSTLALFKRLLLFFLFSLSTPASAEQPDQSETTALVFGVYAHIRSTEMIQKMVPFQQYLERFMAEQGSAVDIQIRIYPSYTEAIDGLVNGEVDFARYGPASYVVAKSRNPNIRLVAMESNFGSKRFEGVLAVPVKSPVRQLADLKGKRIAFGDRQSTTGRYLSQAVLVKAGLKYSDFSKASYLDRHDKVAFAVASGQYDVGAMNENTFNKYAQAKGLRTLARFPCVTKPWIVREGFAEPMYQMLRAALLRLEDQSVLKSISRSGYLPAQDSDYQLIREGMAAARSFDEMAIPSSIHATEE